MEWAPILLFAGVILLSALPLTIAVKILGGRTSIWEVLFANFIILLARLGLVVFVPSVPSWIPFILMIAIYKYMFDIGWIKSFFAWLLQFVLAFGLTLLLVMVGITVALV